jgi:D-alanyl-D-alanine carboxypeptidase/D-alanyl-D-alanine-endopeptidase (penicillin-binding protein 4)
MKLHRMGVALTGLMALSLLAAASPSGAQARALVNRPASGAGPAVVTAQRVFSPSRCQTPVPAVVRSAPVRRVATLEPSTGDELASNLQCLLYGSVRGGRWGIMVVSLTRGDTLFELDAGSPLLPASTMKLFTAALALDQLGAMYQFRTSVRRDGDVDSSGVLHGNLILQGGGDPAFSSGADDALQPAPMDALAELVRGMGVKAVTGNLVADPSAFDSRLVPEGWLNRYLGATYAARVSALSLNSNVANVVVAPGERDDTAPVALDPPVETMSVQSVVRTMPGRTGSNISLRRVNDVTFEVRGWIGERALPRRLPVVVEDPSVFTAAAFKGALQKSGVQVAGNAVVAVAPFSARHVVDLPSPPLADLVTTMNRLSINHYAELIFRNAGRGADGLMSGSADAGFLRLSDFLQIKVGVDPGSVYAVDGSGLSVLNRVTPRSLVQLLAYSHRAQWGDVLHGSLPVAGQSATLSDRMRNTSAQSNLHAKTGTTSTVASLAGYVTAANGELLAFAFLYNGPDRDRARATMDAIGPAMADLVRR